jgi:hypothetical protein
MDLFFYRRAAKYAEFSKFAEEFSATLSSSATFAKHPELVEGLRLRG